MSEAERAQALKSIQLELFQLKQDYLVKRKELTRRLTLIHGKGLKTCRKCRLEMDVEQFYQDSRYRDGYYPYCRECQVKRISRKGNVRPRGVAA
jgi:hypothetical protein